MKQYEVTLWFFASPSLGFQGCYSYETVTASSNSEARKFAKDKLLTHRGYSAKIISVRLKNS